MIDSGSGALSNYFFIVNPAACRGKGARTGEALKQLARDYGLDFDLQVTSGPKRAIEMARNAIGKFEHIVAVGGDGTINEVVNGIGETGVRLGVIPVGSGNDFVNAIGIPRKLQQSLKTLTGGNTRNLDLGKAGHHYFANGLGIGFDSWVVEQALKVKKLRGSLIYLYSVLRTIYSYSPPIMHLAFSDTVIDDKLFMVTVGNGVSMGGGFKLTPEAIMDDGLFDVNIISELTKPEIYQNLLRVYAGTHTRMKQVTTARTDSISVRSDEGFAAHVDGELISLKLHELDVQLIPKALQVVAPI